jgi:hypothetical protein
MHNTAVIEDVSLLSCFELGELSSTMRTKEVSRPLTGPSLRGRSLNPYFLKILHLIVHTEVGGCETANLPPCSAASTRGTNFVAIRLIPRSSVTIT